MRVRNLTALAASGILVMAATAGVAYADPPPSPVASGLPTAQPAPPGPPGGLPTLSTASAAVLAQHVDKAVIVVLKNQHPNAPATRVCLLMGFGVDDGGGE